MNPNIRKYLAKIGSKGGSKSKRVLTPEQARKMVKAKIQKRRKAGKGKSVPSGRKSSPVSE